MSDSREDSGWEDDFDPQSLLGTIVDDGDARALKLSQLLGSGSYALVYSAEPVNRMHVSQSDVPVQETSTCDAIAVKVLFKRGLSATQMRLQRLEAELLTTLGEHEGIVRLRRMTEDRDFLYLVLDRCDEDLYEAIESSKINGRAVFYDLQDEMDMVECIKDAFCQIVRSIQFCHSKNVYHRDLKPENILTVSNPTTGLLTTKLTDFGLATRERRCFDYGTGSASYTAPEALYPPKQGEEDAGYDAAANDVWSLGIVLFNLLTTKNPWVSASDDDESYVAFRKWFRRVSTASPQSSVPLSPISLEYGLSDRCDAVFRRVFDPNPETRCSTDELLDLVVAVPRFNASRACVPLPHLLSTSLPAPSAVRANNRTGLLNHQMRRNRSWSSDMSDMDFSAVPVFEETDDDTKVGTPSRRFSRISLLSAGFAADDAVSPGGTGSSGSISIAVPSGSAAWSRSSLAGSSSGTHAGGLPSGKVIAKALATGKKNLLRPLLMLPSSSSGFGSRSSLTSSSPALSSGTPGWRASPNSSPLNFRKMPIAGSSSITASRPSAVTGSWTAAREEAQKKSALKVPGLKNGGSRGVAVSRGAGSSSKHLHHLNPMPRLLPSPAIDPSALAAALSSVSTSTSPPPPSLRVPSLRVRCVAQH
ncbi:hypothetical protein HDU67_004962 [Dinochytrium kinnereticum]|nr:hypothetical protein HDU67_004962 [Dinochytrium kinnereticum]